MFSHDLCIEELNDLVQLPMASHKTEQPGLAEMFTDYSWLGMRGERESAPITASCRFTSDSNGAMNERHQTDKVEPLARPSRNCFA